MDININVTVSSDPSEADRFWRHAEWLQCQVQRAIESKIQRELDRGNVLFKGIDTHCQFLAALKADEARRRKEAGFWKWHFGNPIA